ncbi:uncharacterized protein LOC144258647 isoform X2 [Eretmochelys imbricata]
MNMKTLGLVVHASFLQAGATTRQSRQPPRAPSGWGRPKVRSGERWSGGLPAKQLIGASDLGGGRSGSGGMIAEEAEQRWSPRGIGRRGRAPQYSRIMR